MVDRSRGNVGSRMEPDTNDLQPELNDEHWLLIADLFSNASPSPKGGPSDGGPPSLFRRRFVDAS